MPVIYCCITNRHGQTLQTPPASLPVSVGQQCGRRHAGAPARGRTRLCSGSARGLPGAAAPPGGRSPPCLRSQRQQLHLLPATDSGQPAPRQQGRQQAPRAGLHAGQSPAPPGTHGSDSPSPRLYPEGETPSQVLPTLKEGTGQGRQHPQRIAGPPAGPGTTKTTRAFTTTQS